MGFAVMKQAGLLTRLCCPDATALTFLQRLESLYFPANPYHNATHAAAVAHQALTFFNILDSRNRIPTGSKDLTRIALWTAALAHDVNHPALSNAFLVNTRHTLATVYNDVHVLENFHSALTFQTLEGNECNIFENLDKAQNQLVRTLIVEMILATDMKEHFDILSRFRVAHTDSPGKDPDSTLLMKMVIKAADIGHAVLEWADHLEWFIRCMAEFYAQGDEELRMAMEISPLCDRSKVADIGDSQAGFLHFVVQPLYEELSNMCDNHSPFRNAVKTLSINVEQWKAMTPEQLQSIEVLLRKWVPPVVDSQYPRTGGWALKGPPPSAVNSSASSQLPVSHQQRRSSQPTSVVSTSDEATSRPLRPSSRLPRPRD
eukprot:Selendium_serpulae@DN3410_c1_g2_i1.p1